MVARYPTRWSLWGATEWLGSGNPPFGYVIKAVSSRTPASPPPSPPPCGVERHRVLVPGGRSSLSRRAALELGRGGRSRMAGAPPDCRHGTYARTGRTGRPFYPHSRARGQPRRAGPLRAAAATARTSGYPLSSPRPPTAGARLGLPRVEADFHCRRPQQGERGAHFPTPQPPPPLRSFTLAGTRPDFDSRAGAGPLLAAAATARTSGYPLSSTRPPTA